MQWIYGLFLDMMSYCANALLGVMSTDLEFFETSVPVVRTLYAVLVAIGWGLLIGNCAFQCMKAMFAGFGFETESPVILLLRTFLFGFLLIFSGDICEIGLSIGKRVIDLLGVPTSISLTLPNESMFGGIGASWLLVIIVGFVLGFQLIKLFFEIAERYVLVAVLTLLCPIGLAFGGSKSTKDICTGFIRTYASMIVMMVMNVLFLKLILSALSSMPTGAMVLPWCLLVVGIAKTARKADQLVSRIGLNPAMTGDPLGVGKGMMVMAVRNMYNGTSGTELKGKKLGIHAYGNVGRNVARIARGFGMEIYAYDAFCPKEVIEADGAKAVDSAEELYAACDVVSLHIPATAETKNSINYALVNKMPKGGLLVNTARKEVINEAELIQLMEERADLKYVTDVMPAANAEFAEKFAGRYFSTPKKMGAQTAEANINAGIAAAQQIVGFLKDGCERFRVNK